MMAEKGIERIKIQDFYFIDECYIMKNGIRINCFLRNKKELSHNKRIEYCKKFCFPGTIIKYIDGALL